MGATFARIKAWINGEVLTHTDLNAEFTNILDNLTPAGVDDASTNLAAMQTTTDPFPASSESLPTSAAGEIERIRYQIKTQFGLSQWYHDTTIPYETFLTTISGYRRPRITWVSVTTVDVENNTGTLNQTKIVFPDGTTRSVTEDTSSTNKYRRFIITAAAEFTSGTEDSGVRSGIAEANNTWYAIYAVKSVISASNFVLAGDTTLPLQTNFSTLNSRYGTNGWVYLGLIRNGDSGTALGDILKFTQSGNTTLFTNTLSAGDLAAGGTLGQNGILEASGTGAASYTATYTAGTGDNEYPGNITMALWQISAENSAAALEHRICDAAAAYNIAKMYTPAAGQELLDSYWHPIAQGLQINNALTTTIEADIILAGFIDGVLGVGANPLL